MRFDDALHEFDTIHRCRPGRHRHHLEPQGPRPSWSTADEPVTLRLDVPAAPSRRHRRPTSSPTPTSRSSTATSPLATLNTQGPVWPSTSPSTNGRGLRVSADKKQHQLRHHRCHPDRLDLLAGAACVSFDDRRRPASSSPGRLSIVSSSRSRPTVRSAPREALASAGAPPCGHVRAARRGDERRTPGPRARRDAVQVASGDRPIIENSRSRTSSSPSVPATASSVPRSTPSASCCEKSEDDLLGHHQLRPEERSTRSSRSLTSEASRSGIEGLIDHARTSPQRYLVSAAAPPTRRR